MPDLYVAKLPRTDWGEEWRLLQQNRRKASDVAFWDKRAQSFATKDAPSAYVRAFLKLADLDPADTVFDMGCGTGSLALPLAEAGHEVLAADFSQGMLDVLTREQEARQLYGLRALLMSWEDDWERFGVTENSADVCVASRSVAVDDMRAALLRLTSVARKRVCITLAAGSSPRTDEHMLRQIGLAPRLERDYQYAFNILVNEGLRPSVNYISSTRNDTFDNREFALASFQRMVDDVLGEGASATERAQATSRLQEWLDANLVENEQAGMPDEKGLPQGAVRLRKPRVVTWAFLSWEA